MGFALSGVGWGGFVLGRGLCVLALVLQVAGVAVLGLRGSVLGVVH